MKVSELEGVKLNYWVAKAIGWKLSGLVVDEYATRDKTPIAMISIGGELRDFEPSSLWEHGGPIIDMRDTRIGLHPIMSGWRATIAGMDRNFEFTGKTALIAAMRAKVASVYGDNVPDDKKTTSPT